MSRFPLLILLLICLLPFTTGTANEPALKPTVVVAQGEAFAPSDAKGWAVTPQKHSLAAHTYGGMWTVNGGLLGAPADSEGSVAECAVVIPMAGAYRVWSKYQAPPYHNYLHRIEVLQGGKVVYTHDYGRRGTLRLWSFRTTSDELWWSWGVDHDAAEAPEAVAKLAAGPATLRLTTLANPEPAGPRMVDFVLLTTEPTDTYIGLKNRRSSSPFAFEAFNANELYMRFKNSTAVPAQVDTRRVDHFQPNYGRANAKWPEQPVAAGAWSPWVNIGPFLRLVHNDALWPTLGDAATLPMEFARDAAGKDVVGRVNCPAGESVTIPLDIIWNKDAKVSLTRDLGEALIAQAKAWPKANGGRKPSRFLFYGSFRGPDWTTAMKDALGYNTMLPDEYEHVPVNETFTHAGDEKKIRRIAAKVDKEHFKVLSFGDEIPLGGINARDPKMQEAFTAWLKERHIGNEELGRPVEEASLVDAASDARIHWYATLFKEYTRFMHFRDLTALTRELIGPQVLTGANYSPHSLTQYYGSLGQWVDMFREDGMSMYWSEDYIFSVPEPPAILSWHFAMMNAAVRHNGQPIRYYVMPHAPGQPAGMLRRNMLFAAGNGAAQIDNFWIGPQEYFTENYVAWQYTDSFKALHDSIYETAAVEDVVLDGVLRPAKVALVISKATQVNEDTVKVPKEHDPFAGASANAPREVGQTMSRKEQQALYLALRDLGVDVDLITEDDIYKRNVLPQYGVVFFAGEWVDTDVIPALTEWVRTGGTLFASAGLGHLNQYNQPESRMLALLGLAESPITKKLFYERTLLELPLVKPISTVKIGDATAPMVGWSQALKLMAGEGAKVVATWVDGSAAVTERTLGKGRAIAVGGLPGVSRLKTGLKAIPWARGGTYGLYHPSGFDPALTSLIQSAVVRLGDEVSTLKISAQGVEGRVIDSPKGSLLTLVNWHLDPATDVRVAIKLPKKPVSATRISDGKALSFTWVDDTATLKLDLADADYVLFK